MFKLLLFLVPFLAFSKCKIYLQDSKGKIQKEIDHNSCRVARRKCEIYQRKVRNSLCSSFKRIIRQRPPEQRPRQQRRRQQRRRREVRPIRVYTPGRSLPPRRHYPDKR